MARLEYAAPLTMEEMSAGMIETTGLDRDTVIAWINAVWGPDSVQARAGVLGGALDPTSGYMNTRAWARLEVPANRSFYMSLGFWRACPPMRLIGPASFSHPAQEDRSVSLIPMPMSALAT